MDLSGRLTPEAVQRQALLVLYRGLNNKIQEMITTWESEDEELWTELGRGYPDWTIEEIADENFYPGISESLMKAPIGNFPNCSVICYRGSPTNSSDDTGELYNLTLLVEVMVKSGTFDSDYDINLEQQVNSRIQKTVDAVHLTLLDNPTLGNQINNIGAPSFEISEVMLRREERGKGPKWYFQAGLLTYPIFKYVNLVN